MFLRRCWSYILFSHLISLLTSAAEIGYGPLFDPCGDNCQTQIVNFARLVATSPKSRIVGAEMAKGNILGEWMLT